MSAPGSAYLGKMPNHIVGVLKDDNYVAKKLSAYGSSILELFYVEKLLSVKKGSDVGFLGAIENNPSGLYYQLHSSARFSKVRLKAPDGKIYIVLNDAGLNTKGLVWAYVVITTSIAGMTMQVTYRSAYYLATTAYGIRYRYRNNTNTGWLGWTTLDMQPSNGAIPQQTSQDLITPGVGGSKGIVTQVQAYITNGEGTFYGEMQDIYPTGVPVTLWEGSYGGAGNVWYIDDAGISTADNGGVVGLYQYEDFSAYQQGGGARTFWIDATHYYLYGYDVFSNKYIFLSFHDTSGPIYPPTPASFSYSGYSSYSQLDANSQVMGNAGQHAGTLYLNPSDGAWYTGYSGTSPSFSFSGVPSDGFYARGDISEITGELYLIGGINQY